MKTVTVGEGKYRGTTHTVLQRAVDEVAAAGGGTVVVAPGVYEMRDALHLRSGVRVVGRPGTVLRKAPSAESPVPAFLGYGHYEIIVAEPDKFPVGTGVHILDSGSGGFYTTVATVIGREGDRLFINRNGIDVGGVGRKIQADSLLMGAKLQSIQQASNAVGPLILMYEVEGLQPLSIFVLDLFAAYSLFIFRHLESSLAISVNQ